MLAAYGQLIEDMTGGALVLTANRRLYRYLQDRYDQYMIASGRGAWEPPKLLSYEAWLQKCLGNLGEEWRLLNPLQVQYVWEQLIETSSAEAHGELELLQIPKTAEKAIQAYRLLTEYELDLEPELLTEDQLVFRRWHSQFSKYLTEHLWFDKSALPARVRTALAEGTLPLPAEVKLVGFDQLPPGLMKLQQLLLERGCDCREVPLGADQQASIVRYEANDRTAEVETAACWVRNLLDRGETGIGVVVPDLTRRRKQLERIFKAQIDPAGAVRLNDEEAVFSLSLGGPLSEQGVIHAALSILQVGPVLSFDQVSFLLRTAYLGSSQSEADQRALFEVRLRSYNQKRFKLTSLVSMAASFGLRSFGDILDKLSTAAIIGDRLLPGAWCELFANHLQELGWPGERTLTSREYQALKSWQQNVLEIIPQLDTVGQALSKSKMVSVLSRMTHDTEFQVEAPTGPVQVVGLLESTGLQFNHLWVMGLEERIFPAAPQPNPFIPYQLQILHAMPHADAAKELAYAEQVMERLLGAAGEVILSCPKYDGDTELQPSPLLPPNLPTAELSASDYHDLLHRMIEGDDCLETITDNKGPQLHATLVEGGTGLLKDQAHCPFRAFVHHRLHGRGLDMATPGISAMERGDLVHLALENIWQHLQEQAQLIALDDMERSALVHEQVNHALDTFYQERPRPSGLMMTLERERITALVDEWLSGVEAQRSPFRVVATEAAHTEQLGPLQIRLKVDRIDELDDGYRIVIDYKTGSQLRADDLVSDPLIEPQLPIYAVAQGQEMADGIVFAQIRKNSCRLLGIVREKGLLGKVGDITANKRCQEAGINDWSQLLVFWQKQIRQLADDFVAGEATVRPFDPVVSCQYCDLTGLCRIQESIMLSGDDNDC